MSCDRADEVTTAFASGDRSRNLIRHLQTCESCKALEQELATTVARLAPDEGEFDDPDLAHDVDTLIKLGKVPNRRQPRWQVVVPALAVAAAMAVFFVVPRDKPANSEFGIRTAAVESEDRWVSIVPFRMKRVGPGYEKVQADLQTDDALLFSVENREQSPYEYVMIFAFDDRGETYWYHPAYLDASTNPKSIALPPAKEPRPLEEAVRHRLSPGWLRIVGLFSREPMDITTVEAAVYKAVAAGDVASVERLRIPETGQHSFLFKVEAPR